MDYEDFLQVFVGEIKNRVSDHIGKNCSVMLEQVKKINRSFDAIQIRPEGSNIAPIVYLESFYEEACQGQPMESLITEALEAIQNSIRDVPAIDLSKIKDYEQIKGCIGVELISAERNAQMLKGVPHTMIEDMAAIYRIHQKCGNGMSGTILISNNLFANYNITIEKLHADAVHNTAIKKPVSVKSMHQILFGPWKQEVLAAQELEDEVMYVATASDKDRGASVLLYENFLDDAAKLLGGDFFVLPTSRQEVILVRKEECVHLDELKEVLKESNQFHVDWEDQLSDNVYHYDSKNHVFELADKFASRQKEALKKENGVKSSVRKDLKEKLEEAAIRSAEPKEGKETVSKSRGGEAI